MLYRDADLESESAYKHYPAPPGTNLSATKTVPIERIVCDEELLPFEENSQDAIMSCLALHWVNDLPGMSFPLSSFTSRY